MRLSADFYIIPDCTEIWKNSCILVKALSLSFFYLFTISLDCILFTFCRFKFIYQNLQLNNKSIVFSKFNWTDEKLNSVFVFLNWLISFYRFPKKHSSKNLPKVRCLTIEIGLKVFFSLVTLCLSIPKERYYTYLLTRSSSFTPFRLSLLCGNFPLGCSNRRGFFSSSKTLNKCIPRELFFLLRKTHQSLYANWPTRVRRGWSGFLEAFSRQVCYTNKRFRNGQMFH